MENLGEYATKLEVLIAVLVLCIVPAVLWIMLLEAERRIAWLEDRFDDARQPAPQVRREAPRDERREETPARYKR